MHQIVILQAAACMITLSYGKQRRADGLNKMYRLRMMQYNVRDILEMVVYRLDQTIYSQMVHYY